MALNVTFVTITAYQFLSTVPGYEAGIQYASELYESININHVTIYRKDLFSCQTFADNSVYLHSQYYYRTLEQSKNTSGSLHTFLGPYCSAAEMLLVSPLAREWNVLLMSMSGSESTISDKRIYPTNVVLNPFSNPVLHLLLEKLLRLYKWTTILLFCDENRISVYYKTNCGNIPAWFHPPQYNTHVVKFDTSNALDRVDFDGLLRILAVSARGL
ncbi:hypothetical protein BV898_18361 [Hypsibius exemplaris]|uniref:Receptor ligand binding region domain-containing protein n=1 Tax=Hypsibius exemplaris TaxID=2072580 RepID=A0A9X6NH29_HYPEX|nr:hypothetical protein BV898_18361 [Hypsibius exemplaris]